MRSINLQHIETQELTSEFCSLQILQMIVCADPDATECFSHTAAASFLGPSFLKEPPSRVDFANETGARVDCSAGGSPPPTISWLSGDGKPVGPIPQTRELLANGSLLFPPFRPSGYRHDVHAATYRCVAENSVGRIHSRDVRVRAGKGLSRPFSDVI